MHDWRIQYIVLLYDYGNALRWLRFGKSPSTHYFSNLSLEVLTATNIIELIRTICFGINLLFPFSSLGLLGLTNASWRVAATEDEDISRS